MNCADTNRWLDQGMPETAARDADSHIRTCPSCARQLALSRSLDRLLAELPADRPSGFADAVMMKVAAEPERSAPSRARGLEAELPWWIRCISEPSSVLSLLLASLLLAWADRFWSIIPAASSSLARMVDPSPAVARYFDWLPAHPAPAAVFGLVLVVAIAAISIVLYKGSRWVTSA